MSIVEQIQMNDPELVELRLAEEPEAYSADTAELITALKNNTVIEYVRLDRDFLPGMEPEHAKPFFEAFGSMANLKEAQIWHAAISVNILADFVTAAKGLEILQLGCLDLAGSEEDFATFSGALKGHPHLTNFSMSDFSLNNDSVCVDHLVETLATIPNLKVVKLEVSHARRRSVVGSEAAARKVTVNLSGKALAGLLRCPTLEELYLNRLNLSLMDYKAISEAIKTAPTLKVFALPHCNLDDQACIGLAVAIGESKSLKKLDFSCNKLTDEGCVTLASALKGNSSVSFLRLWGNVKVSNTGFDAIREMLEQNCVLERVPLMAPLGYEQRIEPKQNRSQAHAA